MNRDRVKGMIDEVAGSAKRKAGELTDDTRLQVKGMAQQVKGKVEGAWGKAKEAVRDAIDDTEVQLDAHVTLKSKTATTNAACTECKQVLAVQ